MVKYLFILNPMAGKTNRTAELSTMIKDYFDKKDVSYEIVFTEYPNHAKEIAEMAAKTGEEIRIYAFGGDGTLNEVITGAYGYDNAEIGYYPCGTGNDSIKCFPEIINLFNDFDALIKGRSIRLDLIKSGKRLGINYGNIGFDAEVVRNVALFKKKFSGVFAYTLSILYCLLFKMNFKLKITIDDEDPVEDRFILVVGANGTTYGGGYKAAPHAVPDDGLLDMMMIKKVSRLKFLSLLSSYKKGLHTAYTDIVTYKQGHKMKIESENEISNTIDGEVYYNKVIEYEILPGAVKFILPAVPEGTEVGTERIKIAKSKLKN